jgi:hypothetical protein
MLYLDGHASHEETNNLIKFLSESCFMFMYGKTHGHVLLLDPPFIGDGLCATKPAELENILINTPMDDYTPIDE